MQESPRRKDLRDLAHDFLTIQGQTKKKRAQAKITVKHYSIGTIVQIPVHNVDTTKADGKNLTLVVVEVVKKKDNSCPMYHLACKAGVLDTLYHPSYIKEVSASNEVMGLDNACDQWTGLPRIKERQQLLCLWLGGRGNILVVDAKVALVIQGIVNVLKQG